MSHYCTANSHETGLFWFHRQTGASMVFWAHLYVFIRNHLPREGNNGFPKQFDKSIVL